jgi:hypothetical protein
MRQRAVLTNTTIKDKLYIMDTNTESILMAAFVKAEKRPDGSVLVSSLGSALKYQGFEFTGKLLPLLREYAQTESNAEGIFCLYETLPYATPGTEYITLAKSEKSSLLESEAIKAVFTSSQSPRQIKLLGQKTGVIFEFDVERNFGLVTTKEKDDYYTFLGTTQHINHEILNDLLSSDPQKSRTPIGKEIKFEIFMRLGKKCATKIRYIGDYSIELKTIRQLVSTGDEEKAVQEYEDLLKTLVVPNNTQTMSELLNELIPLYTKIATDEYMKRAEELKNNYKGILSTKPVLKENPSVEQSNLSGKGYITKFPVIKNPHLGFIRSNNGAYPFVAFDNNMTKEFKELLNHPESWPFTPVEFDILLDKPDNRKTTNLRISSKRTGTRPEKTPEDNSVNNIPVVFPEPTKDLQLTPASRKRVLEEIIEKWRQEGGEEDSKYFYYRAEIKGILNGDKYYVIGRKGSGKSAIAKYIIETLPETESSFFAKEIFFSDLPNYKGEKKGNPYYENECLLLIYKKFYDLLMDNSSEENKEKLDEYVRSYSEDPKTGRLVRGEASDNIIISPKNLCEIYKKALLEYADSASYYLTFDGLDNKYDSYSVSVDPSDEKYENFDSLIKLLTSLFIAVHDFKEAFRKEKEYSAENKKFNPIVFLRDDILDQITHPDSRKWSGDHGFSIDWNENNIKKLIAFRISKAISPDFDYPFDFVWPLIFDQKEIRAGARGLKKKNAFEFIADFTQMRPRDFITYISKCAENELNSPLSQNDYLIKTKTVKTTGKVFSNILRDEIGLEIQVLLPEYRKIFGLIPKQCFTYEEFEHWYNVAFNEGYIKTKIPVKKILEILFNFNVIGRQPKGEIRDQYENDGKTIIRYDKPAIFKYMNKNVMFIPSESFYVHKGLFAAFSIY